MPLDDLSRSYLDGIEFARDGRRMVGRLPLAHLDRLKELLLDSAGELVCAINGEQDAHGGRFLAISVSGELAVCCQRCLAAMTYSLRVESRLRLVGPNEAWPDAELADDESDAIEAGREMAVLPLIEEEVLLALPIAPRHEQCEAPAATDRDRGPSAFAVLAKLKKH